MVLKRPLQIFNGFWGDHHHWMFLGGLTIAINGFTMVFWCCYHRFQWFSMVPDHWSNDAMVSMDRCGLNPGLVLNFLCTPTVEGCPLPACLLAHIWSTFPLTRLVTWAALAFALASHLARGWGSGWGSWGGWECGWGRGSGRRRWQ